MKTGAIVLAAGESQISNIPMLKQELDTLRKAGISPVVVVTGHNKEEVMKDLVHRKVIFVNNPRFKTTGMLKSIQLGLSQLKGDCDKAIIVPADVPTFHSATLKQVVEAEGELVIPCHKGEKGHPLCVDMACADVILNYKGREGMRGIIEKSKLKTETVDVGDPGILLEADSKKSLKKAMKYQEDTLRATPIGVSIDVGLGRTESFFNEEFVSLLKEIESCESMNRACKNLDMAYSRGWKMVKFAEEQLGFALTEKQTGGANGGGSGLTVKGKNYIEKYEKLHKMIEKYAKKNYEKIFMED